MSMNVLLLTTLIFVQSASANVLWYAGEPSHLPAQIQVLKSLSATYKATEILNNYPGKKINDLEHVVKEELEKLLEQMNCDQIKQLNDLMQDKLKRCAAHHKNALHVSIKRNCLLADSPSVDQCASTLESAEDKKKEEKK